MLPEQAIILTLVPRLLHIENGTLGRTHSLPNCVAATKMIGHRVTAAGMREDSMTSEAELP